MRLFSIVSAAAVAVAALAVTPDAFAQRNRGQASVVVIDTQRLLRESAMGRDMQAKLQGVGNQISGELPAGEGQAIEQERQRLAGVLRNQSEAQRAANREAQAFQRRYEQFVGRQRVAQADLQCSAAFAEQEFNRLLEPVLRSVMQERRASIVMDSRGVLEFAPEVDITPAVVQALDGNQATRTLTVSRRRVADCQAQQQQQPAQPPAQ